jgi:hypothetical protein
MTKEGTIVKSAFEKKTGRKIYGSGARVKEGKRWRIRTKKEIKDTLRGEDFVKFIKFLQPR